MSNPILSDDELQTVQTLLETCRRDQSFAFCLVHAASAMIARDSREDAEMDWVLDTFCETTRATRKKEKAQLKNQIH